MVNKFFFLKDQIVGFRDNCHANTQYAKKVFLFFFSYNDANEMVQCETFKTNKINKKLAGQINNLMKIYLYISVCVYIYMYLCVCI